jgi:hypothetical protein
MTITEAKDYLNKIGVTNWEVKEVKKPGGQGITLQ